VVKLPGDIEDLLEMLRKHQIIGGLNLDRFYPELKDHLLVCVTETVGTPALNRMIDVCNEFAINPKLPASPEATTGTSVHGLPVPF